MILTPAAGMTQKTSRKKNQLKNKEEIEEEIEKRVAKVINDKIIGITIPIRSKKGKMCQREATEEEKSLISRKKVIKSHNYGKRDMKEEVITEDVEDIMEEEDVITTITIITTTIMVVTIIEIGNTDKKMIKMTLKDLKAQGEIREIDLYEDTPGSGTAVITFQQEEGE